MATSIPVGSQVNVIFWVGFRFRDNDLYKYAKSAAANTPGSYEEMVRVRQKMLDDDQYYRDVTPVMMYAYF